ncbi:hypothetical protein PQX77_016927 [Marasmius sp. AFHP31]|nr:hypothetical protein PQX77_016927 [Marasmius sp. AFHP31]
MATATCIVPSTVPLPEKSMLLTAPPLDPLTFFSSITIHGLASSDGGPCSLNLLREQTFPAKRYRDDHAGPAPEAERWDPLPRSVGRLHADLEIIEQLSEGRIGMVFTARLVSLKRSSDGDVLPAGFIPLPTQFCVKLAKPEYIRSLAREAWFYEQLSQEEGYPGAITPYCFGFFTSPLPHVVQLPAWSSARIKPRKPSNIPADEEYVYDYLRDDNEFSCSFVDDDRTCFLRSPWALKQWKSRADRSPIIGVLVTERLSGHFPLELRDSKSQNQLSDQLKTEMGELLDDLSAAGILHDDFKYNNILCPSLEPWLGSQICPHHKRVHPWRVIDFDRTFRWNPANPDERQWFTFVQRRSLNDPKFWGSS